jgi:hypothetical protein
MLHRGMARDKPFCLYVVGLAGAKSEARIEENMRFGDRTSKAKGFAYSDDSATVKIAVAMPRENFEYMRRKAIAKGWSISEVIREYVATGIYVDQDMGEEFPEPAEQVCNVDLSRAPGLAAALGVKRS